MSFLRCDLPYQPLEFSGERFPWLGGDLQTLRNNLISLMPPVPPSEEMVIDLPDGDQLLGHYHKTTSSHTKGIIIIAHGLAGDCDSSYVRYLAADALKDGFDALRLNLRGAGNGADLARSSYHAGRADDLATSCFALQSRFPDLPLFLCAYSLGGTMAVNMVARHSTPSNLTATASFCAPLDMTESAERFHAPRNHLYNRHFTKSLITLALARLKAQPKTVPFGLTADRIKALASVREFDDVFTSQIAGYRDAADYYRGTTPLRCLDKITTPTLLIHSDNDPLIPDTAYRNLKSHEALFCAITNGGGHVGFHGRKQPYDCWQSQIALQFFNYHL